jgi:hypothetical protein
MLPPGYRIFGQNPEIEGYDSHWIVKASKRISHEDRTQLKCLGWKLQRHSATNREIWVYDKRDADDRSPECD